MKNVMWKLAAIGATTVAGIVGTKISNGAWKVTRGDEPPSNVNDPEISAGEAIAFALLSGAVIGTAKLLASRSVAKARFNSVEGTAGTAKA